MGFYCTDPERKIFEVAVSKDTGVVSRRQGTSLQPDLLKVALGQSSLLNPILESCEYFLVHPVGKFTV